MWQASVQEVERLEHELQVIVASVLLWLYLICSESHIGRNYCYCYKTGLISESECKSESDAATTHCGKSKCPRNYLTFVCENQKKTSVFLNPNNCTDSNLLCFYTRRRSVLCNGEWPRHLPPPPDPFPSSKCEWPGGCMTSGKFCNQVGEITRHSTSKNVMSSDIQYVECNPGGGGGADHPTFENVMSVHIQNMPPSPGSLNTWNLLGSLEIEHFWHLTFSMWSDPFLPQVTQHLNCSCHLTWYTCQMWWCCHAPPSVPCSRRASCRCLLESDCQHSHVEYKRPGEDDETFWYVRKKLSLPPEKCNLGLNVSDKRTVHEDRSRIEQWDKSAARRTEESKQWIQSFQHSSDRFEKNLGEHESSTRSNGEYKTTKAEQCFV